MTAYYNEIDPFAAEWLRNLIKGGHIAEGDVDERSIVDVKPEDLTGYTQCHFFAGIGVWSHALRQAGWPDDTPVWTGSCPCQPFSAAGKRKGTNDARHLWPEFYRLISECNPPTVFGEQVAQKAGTAWFDLVQADLESQDYASGMVVFPACGVGSPHLRQRLYWFANSLGDPTDYRRIWRAKAHHHQGWESGEGEQIYRPDLWDQSGRSESIDIMADPIATGSQRLFGSGKSRDSGRCSKHGEASQLGNARQPRQCTVSQNNHTQTNLDEGRRETHKSRFGEAIDLADTSSPTSQWKSREILSEKDQSRRERIDHGNISVRYKHGSKDGGMADPSSTRLQGGLQRGENAQGENQHGHARCGGADHRPGPTNGFWAAGDWLYCRDEKWRIVEPGSFPLADRPPGRVGKLRGYGNAIVSPQAQAFIESFIEAKVELPIGNYANCHNNI